MKKHLFITTLLALLVLNACSSAPEPQPTVTPIPTEIQTPEPQPTATEVRVETGFYALAEDGWAVVYEDELNSPIFLPEDMLGGNVEDAQLIQYGYFIGFDAETSVMTLRVRVMPGVFYRDLEFLVDEGLMVTCLPEMINDTPIQDITFMAGKTLSFPPGPGKQPLADILPELNENSYLVPVLAAPVQAQEPNEIFILAGICP